MPIFKALSLVVLLGLVSPGSVFATVPPLNADRAFSYLTTICRIGPRISGSTGMAQQQRVIADHFLKLGAQVSYQTFDVPHPLTGAPVRMANMIITWNPDAKERLLFCCHYDTRPFPDRDRLRPRGRFIGANDGGSGVALMMEMGHHMRQIKPKYGIDFVIFDGEELIYMNNDFQTYAGEYFLGSTYFSNQYIQNPPDHKYIAGALVDMVGSRRLKLYIERNSYKLAPQVTKSVWQVAKRRGVRQFVYKLRHEVQDDHLPLNRIAKIPTTDLIDFDYPHWHTTQDLPVNCSGRSLATVGEVMLAWFEQYEPPAER